MLNWKLLTLIVATLLTTQSWAVIGGRIVPATDSLKQKIVLIYLRNTPGGASVCTGSLLPNNLILTAAHCVVDVNKKDITLIFGSGIDCAKNKTCPMMSVADLKVHPEYSRRRTFENAYRYIKKELPKGTPLSAFVDLAVLKIKGNAPSSYTAFTHLGFPNAKPEEIIQIGFGATGPFSEEIGKSLRSTQKTVTELSIDKDIPLVGVYQPDQGVCHGDSGGPLVMQNENEIALTGVADSVISEDPRPEKACSSAAIYTRVDVNLPWIQQSTAELNARSN